MIISVQFLVIPVFKNLRVFTVIYGHSRLKPPARWRERDLVDLVDFFSPARRPASRNL